MHHSDRWLSMCSGVNDMAINHLSDCRGVVKALRLSTGIYKNVKLGEAVANLRVRVIGAPVFVSTSQQTYRYACYMYRCILQSGRPLAQYAWLPQAHR